MSKKKKEHVIFTSEISDIDRGGAVSHQECTGLIASDPKSREERASYKEIMDYTDDHDSRHTNNL